MWLLTAPLPQNGSALQIGDKETLQRSEGFVTEGVGEKIMS
jgi:hypothetical protein